MPCCHTERLLASSSQVTFRTLAQRLPQQVPNTPSLPTCSELPLPITEALCNGCGDPLDTHGHHIAACARMGRVKKRATPTERVLARIFREAGARVSFNAFLRDRNVGVPADDPRRIEVLAQDLPCFAGAQLAVDITLRSVLTSNGEPRPRAEHTDGLSPPPSFLSAPSPPFRLKFFFGGERGGRGSKSHTYFSRGAMRLGLPHGSHQPCQI